MYGQDKHYLQNLANLCFQKSLCRQVYSRTPCYSRHRHLQVWDLGALLRALVLHVEFNESVSSRPGGLITAEALACGLMMDTLPCFLRAAHAFLKIGGLQSRTLNNRTFKENRCQRLRRPKGQTGTFGLNKRTFDACFAVTQTM